MSYQQLIELVHFYQSTIIQKHLESVVKNRSKFEKRFQKLKMKL